MQTEEIRRPVIALLTAVLMTVAGCAARGTDPVTIDAVGPTPARPSSRPLRVATANLWGVSILGLDWADAIDERFAETARRLAANEAELDVVLIQEAWKTSARLALLEHEGVAERFPFRVDVVTRPGGAGLVVLSAIPIEVARFHRFDAQGNCLRFWEGDCLGGKGLLLVGLRLAGRRIWLADTHLIACYAPEDAPDEACDDRDPNGATRWSQLREVRTYLDAEVGGEPVLVGGDFNFRRTSRYHAFLRSEPRGWTEPGVTDADGSDVDYLWSRPGEAHRWQAAGPARAIWAQPVALPSGERVPLSDHPILAAGFCLVPATERSAGCP